MGSLQYLQIFTTPTVMFHVKKNGQSINTDDFQKENITVVVVVVVVVAAAVVVVVVVVSVV